MKPKQTFFLAIGMLVVFASLVMLSLFTNFQQILVMEGVFSTANPLAVFAIFAIIIFGGIYLFKSATEIIKGGLQ